MNGWTQSTSDEEFTRNSFGACLELLRKCDTPADGKQSAQAEYWINRLFYAWREFEQFATLQERRLFERCLLDIMAIDPAHREYAYGTDGYLNSILF